MQDKRIFNEKAALKRLGSRSSFAGYLRHLVKLLTVNIYVCAV